MLKNRFLQMLLFSFVPYLITSSIFLPACLKRHQCEEYLRDNPEQNPVLLPSAPSAGVPSAQIFPAEQKAYFELQGVRNMPVK